ncbi:MAG: IS91 family transposase [Gammaproteobacteria bacterium]|nr:IS91 family transposase [Gammaproteobacteria bacterium]
MARPHLEVADIVRDHGAAFRLKYAERLSLGQLKVLSAIERCRSAALGGHVVRCEQCQRTDIAYNSCRNRHCPKCQASAALQWLAAREEELLPVAYFHAVFTLPAEIGPIAYQNKAAVYGLLFRTVAQTVLTIGADPKHLGAQLGMTAVLHTWGSAMTHHPHLHCIVPGGGLSLDGTRWIPAKSAKFLLPVRVLSALFRRLFCEGLRALYDEGALTLRGHLEPLGDPHAFARLIAQCRSKDWYVDIRAPFAGPECVLAYLARYTHRVAIANSRLLRYDAERVVFRWKDYRAASEHRLKTMALETSEFLRRFLRHVLPSGFHRIRHYGLFANAQRHQNLRVVRALLNVPSEPQNNDAEPDEPQIPFWLTCPGCGQAMRIIEILTPTRPHRARDPPEG